MTHVVDDAVETGPLSAQAVAAALDGDLDTASVLADQAILDGDRRGAEVAAAVLAQRGMLADSVTLYRWAESVDGVRSGFVVAALLGVGDLAQAREQLAAFDDSVRTPTSLSTVESLVAHAVTESVTGSAVAALSQLVQAAAVLEPHAGKVLLPDTPSALACLVALHLGQLDMAESAVGDDSMRHALLRAWISLQRGDLAAADVPGQCARPRDELFAAAIEIGVARRRSDLAGLLDAWPRARDAVIAHPVDLFVLQPVGEIAVAAARLHEDEWLAPRLAEADDLLSRLGRPALWSVPLHWFALQAAVASESPSTAARHAAALSTMARSSRYAAALAGCARAWLRVLAGDVQVEQVVAAARELRAVGLGWDGARLAGQAAIRTADRNEMTTLLTCARALHGVPHSAEESPAPQLSAREIEVAELLVGGMTYKQIGERLFISAKTVEHHVARIRQRLGSASRRELLARLRALVNGQ
ncbi:helix-turn-helix domain-containing protein [Kutzneria kofuensis]|uniref:DNA-binding CsgD family transcriptional regulator n=1 Tax=Kutzneria kofuensis TaxID=103725 RepID=A0A7W9KND0_9PSEU|nr:helix-turn-helix transcriptional regulator [Kutzneria kofuensis]MBB5895660.1 DNA-binding CsgD family transcriptional regulator [Kutzneria kofuensis]